MPGRDPAPAHECPREHLLREVLAVLAIAGQQPPEPHERGPSLAHVFIEVQSAALRGWVLSSNCTHPGPELLQ
ncbi:hypothetical protein GCM10020218_042260 [Dactylosporangium vinaceum]